MAFENKQDLLPDNSTDTAPSKDNDENPGSLELRRLLNNRKLSKPDWEPRGPVQPDSGSTKSDEPDHSQTLKLHSGELTNEILNSMEQGVIVWSDDGLCLMHNDRVFDVLEVTHEVLFKGCSRQSFLEFAVSRNEISPEQLTKTQSRFRQSAPFRFERCLPSGRFVETSARPLKSGGFVVTFTDISKSKKVEKELSYAMEKAETAQANATEALRENEARQRETLLLAELDEWLQSCKSLSELYEIVGSFMGHTLPGTSGELYIYSNSRDVLDGLCQWRSSEQLDHVQPDSCWALRRGRPYAYGDGSISFLCEHVSNQSSDVHSKRYFCIPIIAHGDTVGLLHIKYDQDATFECNSEQELLRMKLERKFAVLCAEHISLAVANAKLRDELRDQSIKDPLTGLYNRRYFLDGLRSCISRADRSGKTFSVLSFDADRFKLFNDNHGHDAGDTILRAISDAVHTIDHPETVRCRYGGEEFAILLPDCDLDQAKGIAEKLRADVETTQVKYANSVLPHVTISIGISSYPQDGKTPQQLLNQADEALYKAKENGRNRVETAEDLSVNN